MPGPSTAGFQLSPQQKHLWSLPDGRRRSAQLALLLEGLVDVQRLQHALQKIVERHEILRTTFEAVEPNVGLSDADMTLVVPAGTVVKKPLGGLAF